MLPVIPPLRNSPQSFQIRLFVANDADKINLPKLFFTSGQRRWLNLNRIVVRSLSL